MLLLVPLKSHRHLHWGSLNYGRLNSRNSRLRRPLVERELKRIATISRYLPAKIVIISDSTKWLRVKFHSAKMFLTVAVLRLLQLKNRLWKDKVNFIFIYIIYNIYKYNHILGDWIWFNRTATTATLQHMGGNNNLHLIYRKLCAFEGLRRPKVWAKESLGFV